MLSHQGLIGVLDGGIYIKGGGIIRTISDIAGIILSQSDEYDQYNDGHVYRAEWLSSIRYSMVIAHFSHTAHTFIWNPTCGWRCRVISPIESVFE